ncbi:MAG: glycosyltransferase family 4 protein [Patescibacteria group bacterium]|nr:glycosyltransferase family 4 protein [Patescibacteria group bacterium]
MKVLMFGWEFPPFNSGGLGTACYGITKSLSEKNIEINFVLPRNYKINENFLNVISTKLPKIKIKNIDSLLVSYMTSQNYKRRLLMFEERGLTNDYCKDLIQEVFRYSQIAGEIASEVNHDVIHIHDWMTFPSGIKAKKVSGKPLVAHVHSTELDRSGGHSVNPQVFEIEKEGLEKADKIIAVSNFTKNRILKCYNVSENKIEVVHNAINKDEFDDQTEFRSSFDINKNKVVLFLGRLTLHKGPDYFLCAAKKVLEKNKDVIFVISGSGDMDQQIIEQAASLGIADRVLFTGFLRGKKLKKIYKMADLYIMPSVSEPFGITALEAIASGTPVLISKQSGASEIVNHCLKTDFWDVNEMANQILSVISHDELGECLSFNGLSEVSNFTWVRTADKIINIYNKLINS